MLAGATVTATTAAPNGMPAGCWVRSEAFVADDSPNPERLAAQSHLGLRAKGTRLMEVDLSVAGSSTAVCSLSGVAKRRGAGGQESLALVVRPDVQAIAARLGTPCQVFITDTPEALELTTTEAACRTQLLCGGQVQLHGQRFMHADRLSGADGPCFDRRAP
jgi:hypothetical protein